MRPPVRVLHEASCPRLFGEQARPGGAPGSPPSAGDMGAGTMCIFTGGLPKTTKVWYNTPMTHNNIDGTLLRCYACKAYLQPEKFDHDASKPSGRSGRCKACQAVRDKGRASGVMAGRRTLILRAKDGKPCVDCGGVFPVAAMDLDHRGGAEKLFAISSSTGWSMVALIDELAKCDAVCANCHRIRTHERANPTAADD